MGCRLAENAPLGALRAEFGIEPSCHSFRDDCVHYLLQPTRQKALAATGAVIGYCQALFHRCRNACRKYTACGAPVSSIGAPWSHSHELYWGHRGADTPQAFINSAFEPFRGVGRVPIVITELRASRDAAAIAEIVAVTPPVEENEPVLVRIILEDRADIDAAAATINRLLAQSRAAGAMPRWWPLLQGDLAPDQWQRLKTDLGSSWKYLNIAVNPFVTTDARALIDSQVTVCQVPVGVADAIAADGFVGPSAEYGLDRPDDGRRLRSLRLSCDIQCVRGGPNAAGAGADRAAMER